VDGFGRPERSLAGRKIETKLDQAIVSVGDVKIISMRQPPSDPCCIIAAVSHCSTTDQTALERGGLEEVTCSIPAHCIDVRRLPLFIARSALRDLIAGLHADAKGVQAA
jgi:hypothetical protein